MLDYYEIEMNKVCAVEFFSEQIFLVKHFNRTRTNAFLGLQRTKVQIQRSGFQQMCCM